MGAVNRANLYSRPESRASRIGSPFMRAYGGVSRIQSLEEGTANERE